MPSPPQFHDSLPADAANSKQGLKNWWKNFTSRPDQNSSGSSPARDIIQNEKEKVRWGARQRGEKGAVFGVPLTESIKYASVAISMVDPDDGKSYIYGYIPVVVAKCGLFLKEDATDTEGVFRVPGSAKRMKELQQLFDTPPKYGKDLVWVGYTVHDAASVLRRYLNMMPEPVIPYELYYNFRECLTPRDQLNTKIEHFRTLLLSLPPSSQCLLLYVLDLLSVFARNSDKNLMTASNLAVVFQPGLVRPPETDYSMVSDPKSAAGEEAKEHKASQEVLEFLIAHQDHFLMGMRRPQPPPSWGAMPISEPSETTPVRKVQLPEEKDGSSASKSRNGSLSRKSSEKTSTRNRLRKSLDTRPTSSSASPDPNAIETDGSTSPNPASSGIRRSRTLGSAPNTPTRAARAKSEVTEDGRNVVSGLDVHASSATNLTTPSDAGNSSLTAVSPATTGTTVATAPVTGNDAKRASQRELKDWFRWKRDEYPTSSLPRKIPSIDSE